MDHESLRTASTYLNNLLLARGLLRNSTPIDFVKPSKESRAQIINLVHDLILREDRDREQREQVAIKLRTARADDARHAAEIVRLREKGEEAARSAEQARAAERVALAEAKKVERAMKALQDQAARLKTSLAQVKTQCANDVRKRDLELARLKTHLQGQQRGSKAGVTAPSITISNGARGRMAFDASVRDVGDPEYSLKQETTEFLTQLSQSLSDENDNLIGLVRGTLGTMQDLLGLPATVRKHHDSAIGSIDGEDKASHDMLHTLPTSFDSLATDMESCMEHLKSILNNPNFVTVEEVEVREEEIVRLREGWVRMEQRWKDVLVMMDGWRRRMDIGESINMDDLRRGMGLVSPEVLRHGQISNTDPEQSFIDESMSEIQLPDGDVDSSSMILEPPRLSSPLKKSLSPKRKLDLLSPPQVFDLRPSGQTKSSRPVSPKKDVSKDVNESQGDEEDDASENEPQLTVAEKLSAAQAEAERAAATATGKDTPVDLDPSATDGLPRKKHTSQSRVSFAGGLDGAMDEMVDEAAAAEAEGDDTLGTMRSPARKTKIRGRPKRRKSTLSPEELEALINADD